MRGALVERMEGATARSLPVQEPALGGLSVAADDHLLRRRVMSALNAAGFTARTYMRGDGEPEPEILVLACDARAMAGMAELRRLRKDLPQVRLVLVSALGSGIEVRRAVEAGADGFVDEAELERSLTITVRAVAAGQVALPRERRGCAFRPAFSHRERQVLALVTEGLTNGEMADRLFLAESTVKSHLSTAFEKLGVRSRREAAALLLDPGESLAGILY